MSGSDLEPNGSLPKHPGVDFIEGHSHQAGKHMEVQAMEKDRLSRWLSIGANVAVLLGLIFVALEVRETRNASIVEAAGGVADGFLQLAIPTLTDTALARTWHQGIYEPEQLSDVEVLQFSSRMRQLFNQFHRVNRLYRAGFIPESEWAIYAREAVNLMLTPGGKTHWENNEMIPELREAIEPYIGQEVNFNFMLGRDTLVRD
jgi:hypothetical protein